MVERSSSIPEFETRPELSWRRFGFQVENKIQQVLKEYGIAQRPMDFFVLSESPEEIKNRALLLELAAYRLLSIPDFPRVSSQLVFSAVEVRSAILCYPLKLNNLSGICFLKEPEVSDIDYAKARRMLLKETNEMIQETGRSSFPEYPVDNRSYLRNVRSVAKL